MNELEKKLLREKTQNMSLMEQYRFFKNDPSFKNELAKLQTKVTKRSESYVRDSLIIYIACIGLCVLASVFYVYISS